MLRTLLCQNWTFCRNDALKCSGMRIFLRVCFLFWKTVSLPGDHSRLLSNTFTGTLKSGRSHPTHQQKPLHPSLCPWQRTAVTTPFPRCWDYSPDRKWSIPHHASLIIWKAIIFLQLIFSNKNWGLSGKRNESAENRHKVTALHMEMFFLWKKKKEEAAP